MALIDLSQSHWQALSTGQAITIAIWNAVLSDLATLLNGSVDRANITDGGLIPGDGDGTFMTLDDGSITGNSGVQTVSRDTAFSGEMLRTASTTTGSDTTPSVTGLNVLYVDNTSGSSTTITALDDGVEGQMLEIFMYGADNVVLQVDAATGGPPRTNAVGTIVTTAGTDITYTAASDEAVWVKLRCTNFGGDYTNLVWVPLENTVI